MIEKIVIRDNKKSPVRYLPEIPLFKKGKVFEFKPGVNVIVGKNGCGKTTLMKIIESYLLVEKNECSKGMFNSNINHLFGLEGKLLDGIDVYSDYQKNVFRLCHSAEKKNDDTLANINAFTEYFTQIKSSTGEGVVIALNSMFKRMFSDGANLMFDFDKVGRDDHYKEYGSYVKSHRMTDHDEWTILMDEPDRNLDIENMENILNILSFHKPQTQVIAVVHNPLLICALSKNKEVNMIELTRGYVSKVKKLVKSMV